MEHGPATTEGIMMEHETTTSDNDEVEALDELNDMNVHTTQAMMHHDVATTTDSAQTTAIPEEAGDALAELGQMGDHSSDSSTASSDDHVTNTPASDVVTEAATEAVTTPEAEIGEDAADALGELGNLA